MTDLLTTLTQRTRGTAPVAEPTIAPRFAPSSEIQEPMTREAPVVPQETETSMTDQFERSIDTAQSRQIDAVRDGKAQSTVMHHEDTLTATQDDNLLRPQVDKQVHPTAEPASQHSQSIVLRHEAPPPATAQGVRPLRPQTDNAMARDNKVPSTVARREAPPPATQDDNLLRPQVDKQVHPTAEPAPERSPSTVVRREDPPPATAQGVRPLRPHAGTTPSTPEQSAWVPTTIEAIRTRQTEDQQQQSRRESLTPQLERLVDTPATNQTRGTPQPLDEMQPSTEEALLVRPRWDSDDQHQRIRDQHQIEPHPVAEVATDDMTDARRTAQQPATEPALAPTIQVSIGRIDVRAKTPTPPMPQTTPKRPQPTLSLDDYLKQRNGGRP